jgi:hypothetical protein
MSIRTLRNALQSSNPSTITPMRRGLSGDEEFKYREEIIAEIIKS